MAKNSNINRKRLSSQSRELISNIQKFMEDEANIQSIPLHKVTKRVAAATKVSERTIQRIIKERKKIESGQLISFVTPGKKRKKSSPITGIDSFEKSVVRRIIRQAYLNERQSPTISSLLIALQDNMCFNGSRKSLWRIIKKLGFAWKKSKSNRAVLIERNDVRAARISYLRKLKGYREMKRPIIYMDETCILSSDTTDNGCTENSSFGNNVPLSKGQRLIIIHAGGEKGFIRKALLIFKSGQNEAENKMNAKNYEFWLKDNLIPNLPPNSVLVIGDAPYHNIQDGQCPTSNSSKKCMEDWLSQHNISFPTDSLKPELYELIKLHKPRTPSYRIDKILEEKNHSVLRLPPHHPDLNPSEIICADLKQWVGKHKTIKIDDVKTFLDQRLSNITESNWASKCKHVEKIEEEYWQVEEIMDTLSESLIINLESHGSDSEDSFSEEREDSDRPSDIE